jgi:hypothetical protein
MAELRSLRLLRAKTMRNRQVRDALESMVAAIRDLDRECSSVWNDLEYGLVHVVWQFQDLALRETGQHLSRERLIVWRLWTKLQNLGWHVDWESPYPRSRRKCDLVVALRNSARLWLEVKVSWRAWFECERGPVHSNPAYRS